MYTYTYTTVSLSCVAAVLDIYKYVVLKSMRSRSCSVTLYDHVHIRHLTGAAVAVYLISFTIMCSNTNWKL
jgi:hypothetical protein